MIGELPKPELIIGIDQSYTGFGLVTLDGEIQSLNVWKFKNLGSESGRLNDIYDTLLAYFKDCHENYEAVHMAMEGYAHGSKFNREKLGELGGIVKLAWFKANGNDPVIVAPTVLKKFVTGKGTASKDQMLEAIQKLDPTIKDHNVADAYGLALYLKDSLGT